MFITFEGSEGGGKSAIIRRLARWLRKRGYQVVVTKEPGGTPLGKRIRSILLGRAEIRIDPLAELLLFYVDRVQHLAEVITPARGREAILLCDRYEDSSVAYQAFGRGIPRVVLSVLFAITGGVKPDLTLLLDVPPEIGLKRKKGSGADVNRLDKEELDSRRLDFHRKVREGYLQLAGEDPCRWVVIDAGRGQEEVWQDVLEAVSSRLEEAEGNKRGRRD